MYYPVVRAKNYEINLDGNVRRTDGKDCEFTTLHDLPAITLMLYGQLRIVTIDWLKYMSYFEVDLPENLFFKIEFTPYKDWHFGNKPNIMMKFPNIYKEYKSGFRYIPNFTRYVVNREGELIDTYSGKFVEIKTSNDDKYVTVYIYSPDKKEFVTTVLHRLVALTWIPNQDFTSYYLVNHVDGNKQNYHVSNLEWVNHSGNAIHAYKNGLRTQNIGCIIRDTTTKKTTEFCSVRDACSFMGVTPKSLEDFKLFNNKKLINGKYQIKDINDKTPWDEDYVKINKSRYKVIVETKDRKVLEFDSSYEMLAYYKFDLSLVKFNDYKEYAIRVAKEKGYKIKFIDLLNSDDIQVLNIKEDKVNIFKSVTEVCNALNVHKSVVRKGLNRGENYSINNYAYRYFSYDPWNKDFIQKDNVSKVIIGIKEGKECKFNSLREAEKITRVNRKYISKNINKNICYNNWYFKS